MTLEIKLENGTSRNVACKEELRPLLQSLNLRGNSFAILERGPDDYIQAALDRRGFVVEWHDGDPDRHYSAARACSSPLPQRTNGWLEFWKRQPLQDRFSVDEVAEFFASYLEGLPPPAKAQWVKLEFS